MIVLNELKGFRFAHIPDEAFLKSRGLQGETGYGRVCINGESFWLRKCVKNSDGSYFGVIDNDLVRPENIGLECDAIVMFRIEGEPS